MILVTWFIVNVKKPNCKYVDASWHREGLLLIGKVQCYFRTFADLRTYVGIAAEVEQLPAYSSPLLQSKFCCVSLPVFTITAVASWHSAITFDLVGWALTEYVPAPTEIW